MRVWNAHKSKVRCVAFSPDGRSLASAAERLSGVGLWNPATGEKTGELRGRWGFTSGVAFSPDGALIATVTADYRVVIWDAKTRAVLSAPEEGRTRYGPAFAPDGSCVAATGWNGVAVWNAPQTPHPDTLGAYSGGEWEPDVVLQPGGSLEQALGKFDSLAFSPTGDRVAANGHICAVVWNWATKKVQRAITHQKTDALTVLTFSPDGQRLAIGFGKTAEVHTLDGPGRPVVLTGHALFVRAVGFTPDGNTVMTAGSDGTVRFWDAATGAPGRVFDWGIGRVYSAAFAPDGLTCAAGGENGQVVVWDVDE